MLYAIPRRKARRKPIFQTSSRSPSLPIRHTHAYTSTSGASQSDHDLEEEEDTRFSPATRDMRTRPLPSWIGAPPIEDDFPTDSSLLQVETADECLPLLTAFSPVFNDHGIPPLARDKHIRFLRRSLGRLPAGFSSLDASRPWILYWCLNALALLGEDMTQFRDSLVETLRAVQNPTGGFGGGFGQYSHLATTYSAVLSIAIVGGNAAYDLIDRNAMWHWLGSLKQPHGDFAICDGGERDVRAAYCAMVMLSLLNLPVELPSTSPARISGHQTFLDGLADWISRCQTYEGGIGCAPDAEAHGAYVFCALACLCILGNPTIMMTKYLDLSALVAWLSARQHAPEGGLAGRANKLVDGCYSHWIGGCWSLVEVAVGGAEAPSEGQSLTTAPQLWNRDGLIRYILCCCQADMGGLRDKPSKNPDAYHTNYNLAGLSSAQNHFQYKQPSHSVVKPLSAPFHWTSSTTPSLQAPKATTEHDNNSSQTHTQIFRETDRVIPIHPVYVIPAGAAEAMRDYFASRPLSEAS